MYIESPCLPLAPFTLLLLWAAEGSSPGGKECMANLLDLGVMEAFNPCTCGCQPNADHQSVLSTSRR